MAATPFLALHHIGIRALDAPALAQFYRHAAGLQDWPALAGFMGEEPGIALAGPNAGLRILPGASQVQRRLVSEAGFTHVCLQSPAIHAVHEAHARHGAGFHCPLLDLGTGFLYCYARDPEQNVIELEGVAPVWPEARPWLAHVNLACTDLRVQIGFYASLTGETATRSPRLAGMPALDQLAEMPGAELRMAWVPCANMQIELLHYSAPTPGATTAQSSRRGREANGQVYVAFEVSDLAEARAHLRHCGGSLADGGLCYDPEGNEIRLLAREALSLQGASVTQLPDPTITTRFALARSALAHTP